MSFLRPEQAMETVLRNSGSETNGQKLRPEKITSGTVLIRKGTLLPESLQLLHLVDLNKGAPANGWTAVQSGVELRQLKSDLHTAGWNYFYMASVQKTAFGRRGENRMASVLTAMMAKMEAVNCNSLQIDKMTAHSFLGIPYLSVCAHFCHIQQGSTFANGKS